VSKILENNKYSDKRELIKYDLSVDIFKSFNLEVVDLVPVRNVFLLFTDKDKKILKKVEYSLEDLEFIYSAITYIKRSFSRVMDFASTVDGDIYTIWNGEVYCVLDLIDGRECEFSNPLDVSIAARGIAKLHSAGEGFRYSNKEKNITGRCIEIFTRRLDEMKFFKSLANMHEIKKEFDIIFLQNVDYYIQEIEKSIDALRHSSYLKLCSEEDKMVICHNDLAHHNIIINNEEAYFIDFDYAVIDLKVRDLSNFVNKAIKNYGFDINRANDILECYCKYNFLDKREKEVLWALLRFPEDFYSISKDYYSRRKDWDEEVFLDRLIKKVQFKEDREEFLSGSILW
jgi:CotS family spore coat protein